MVVLVVDVAEVTGIETEDEGPSSVSEIESEIYSATAALQETEAGEIESSTGPDLALILIDLIVSTAENEAENDATTTYGSEIPHLRVAALVLALPAPPILLVTMGPVTDHRRWTTS